MARIIANTFFRAGLVEAWGRGIEKVIQECIEHGCQEPIFDYRESGLMVEFKTCAAKSEGNVRPEMRPEMRPEKLSQTEQQIVKILKANPSATTRQIADQMGVFKSTITRNIEKLKNRGVVGRIGSTKQGIWRINEGSQP
jgi:ATP-dependent DNA helicase RecG